MLLEFSVKNFRSFKDEATLNMVDEEGVVLNTAVFMGANASGKTNFFKAMFIARVFIRLGKTDASNINICDTYLNNKTPTQYTFLFQQDDLFIKCFFSVIKEEESIYVKKENLQIGNTRENLETIYNRNGSEIKVICEYNKDLCSKVETMKKYFNDMGNPENILFLTTMLDRISSNTTEIEAIGLFFINLDIADINTFESADVFNNLSLNYIFKSLSIESLKKGIIYFLQIADPTVDDVKAKFGDTISQFEITHKLEKKVIDINFNEESGGIRIFLSLFRIVDTMLRENKIWIVDELDSRLHYDLISMIVELIDENKKSSQIIFTCHNIGAWHWNIKNNCFHIVEKINGTSSINRVSEKVGNKDKRISKYMRGGLGGFPSYEYSEKALNNYIDNLGNK